MFKVVVFANVWNLASFFPKGGLAGAASFLMLAQVVGPCGPSTDPIENASDPAQYPSVGCTPDPQAIAARRQCQRDDQCPCGAHCESGVCVATCGAGMPACATGSECSSRSGRCVPRGSDPLLAPVGTASGTVRFDSAAVTLANGTDAQALQYVAGDTSVDRVRFAIEAPFEVRCADGGQWARECTAGPLAAYAFGQIRVRVAQGSTVTPGQRGEVAAHTPVGLAKASVVIATEQTAPVFRVGRFEGTATMTIAGRLNPAAPEASRTARIPIVAYLSGRPGDLQRVLEIEDKSTLFAGQTRVAASLGPRGGMTAAVRLAFPSSLRYASAAPATGASVSVDVRIPDCVQGACLTITSATAGASPLPEEIEFSLANAFVVGGTDTPIGAANWVFQLARVGDLPADTAPRRCRPRRSPVPRRRRVDVDAGVGASYGPEHPRSRRARGVPRVVHGQRVGERAPARRDGGDGHRGRAARDGAAVGAGGRGPRARGR
ncbi:MAG: EB domain-containing protein [Polyangiales bacterium]